MSGLKCGFDSFCALYDTAGREVRTGKIFHYFFQGAVRVVQTVDGRINRFLQIVRRHVCRITCRNTGRTVYQHDRKRNRKNGRFIFRIVKVRSHLDGILVEIVLHDLGYLGKTHFGISHRRSRVIIDGTVVSVHVDQRKTDLPVL